MIDRKTISHQAQGGGTIYHQDATARMPLERGNLSPGDGSLQF